MIPLVSSLFLGFAEIIPIKRALRQASLLDIPGQSLDWLQKGADPVILLSRPMGLASAVI